MALEDLTGTKYIDDLVVTNPAAGDNVSQGDDHIRGIKNVLKDTFPNITGAVTPTHTELNYVDGVTSAIQTQLGAITANDWVTNARVAANAIDSDQYVDGSIDTAHYAAGSVDAAAMGANSVDSSELVDGSVDTSHLSADCVTTAKIADNVALGGSPTTTTQAESDDSTKIATTAYVVDKITTLIGGAPSTLNDLNELAAAINDDASYNSTLTTALGTKLPKAGGTMTGDLNFGDDIDANFGAGTDLKILHDHSNQQNKLLSTSLPLILAGTTVSLNNGANNENMLVATQDGSVDLYHNHVKKFETTAAGATVTGVLTATLQANAIDSDHYTDGSIDRAHIADGEIIESKIQNGNVTLAKMAANSVDSDQYVNGSIDTAHIANDAITAELIGDNVLNSEHYIAGSIDAEHLASDSVTEAKMAANSVDSQAYVDGSIDTAHIGDAQVTAAKLAVDRRNTSATTDIFDGNAHDYVHFDADVGIRFYSANAEDMRLTDAGALHVDGDIIAFSGTISDERLKNNILPITNALSKVGQLNGCTFTYNNEDRRSAGLIAQDVEKVLPSAVSEMELPLQHDDGIAYKTVQYDQTIGLLVEAIKELTAKVEKLENK